MEQKTVKLGKVIVSLSVVAAMLILPTWHTFADLPVNGAAYISAPPFAHTQRIFKESVPANTVPANTNIEEAVLTMINNTLLGLVREERRIYSEYLSLKGGSSKTQEQQYAKKMNVASAFSITSLRKALKNRATPFTMSKSRHNFRALFVLDKEIVKSR